MKHGIHSTLGSILAGAALLGVAAAHAATYYVDVNYDGANGAPDGSETKPWTRLGDAVPAYTTTPYNHTIKVAGGEYKSTAAGGRETFGTTGYDLQCRSGKWQGGYVGQTGDGSFDWSETSRTFPAADAVSATTMTVINLTNANVRAFTTGTTVADHVLVFDGFVFRDSDVSQANYDGGALRVNGNMSASALYNCVFLNNRTTRDGGGAWFGGRWSNSTNLVFAANTSVNGMGGGLFVKAGNSGQDFTDCLFVGNAAVSGGGMATGDWQAFNLTRCVFSDNTATSFGGAVGLGKRSGITGRQCRFTANTAARGSAAGNTDTYSGVAINLENSLVARNTATGTGYALYASGAADYGSVITLRHTTVADNALGGVYLHYGRTNERPVFQLDNTIIVSNGTAGVYCSFPAGTLTKYGDALGRPRINHSVVFGHTADITWAGEAGATCATNVLLSLDPAFADIAAGDYRLAFGSPCIDAGANLGIAADLDGVGRPTRHGFDIGCYEEWQIPIIASRAAVVQPEEAEVRAEFTYESAAIATHAFFVIDTADQGTNSLAAWWQSAGVGEKSQGGIFGAAFSGLSPSTTYFYRCMASNSYDVMWGPVASFKTPAAGGALRVWTGLGGNALASTAGNWEGGVAPSAGDYIVLDGSSSNLTWDAAAPQIVGNWTQTENYGGTVTFQTTYPSYSAAFTNFTVAGDASVAGGSWTHLGPQNHADQRYRLSVSIGGDLRVPATGAITAFGKGYSNNQGPGVGAWDPGRGASHGGQGGSQNLTRGTTYGTIREPVTLGSGGVTGGANNGHGGGSIRLAVTGNADIDGSIAADAFSPTAGWQGGAGGSVWLKAASLSGAGTISADGTQAGGGGRVAVKLDGAAAVQGVALRALGGVHDWNTGAAGTVYVETTAHTPGKGVLTLDNAGRGVAMLGGDPHLANCATRMPVSGSGGPVDLADFTEIVIKGKAVLGLASDTIWSPASSPLTVSGRNDSWVGLTDAGNAVVWPSNFVIDGYSLVLSGPLTVNGNWTVGSDGRITRFRARGAGYSDAERLILHLTGDLTVLASGEIHADYQGYANERGLAPGAWSPGRGGGHGGQGGYTTASPGLTYGSVLTPVTWGSGGVSGGNNNGEGGGAMELTVSGTLTVNGEVRALPYPNGNNGGAGGAILIAAGDMAGEGGTIRARGFNSGGGGRVAVKLASGSTLPDGVAIDARGGTISGWEGAGGTVYTETAAQSGGAGTILIENGHWAAMRTYGVQLPPTVGSFSDDLSKTTLRLRDRGRLTLTADLVVDDLRVSADSHLDLNGQTLRVQSPTSSQAAAVLGTVVENGGKLIWGKRPTLLLLR